MRGLNMKYTYIKILITVIFLLFISTGTSLANNNASASSAKLQPEIEVKVIDARSEVLQRYLNEYDSPLAMSSGEFVKYADEYSLDWRLVAAIAGLESTYGKHIPYNSYNAWGWGIYGDNVKRFNSWEDGIETISKGLRENYLRDLEYSDPYIIGPTYAASPTWAVRVTYFMDRIENYRIKEAKNNLTLAT